MKCPKCRFENPEDTFFCGQCATPLRPSEDISVDPTKTLQASAKELSTGTTFARRYQVIEELGKGGMGRVYKVLDAELQERVALKLIKPEVSADRQTIDRFRSELKIARKVAHPNVCRMYDLGEAEGSYFITMEYVPGEDLKSSLRRMGPLSAGKAMAIARQVCEGLREAHRLGVVHRDLKPQNIMIDSEGNVRIMDFGIARAIKTKGITGTGVMIGTPEYMSPEQVEGEEADQRSDIYSLGIVLYEMVTGRVPFKGETPLSVAVKQKVESPQSPMAINPQIPEELNRLILKCLEKGREKRYQDSQELLLDFERIEAGIPTTEKMALEEKATAKVRAEKKWKRPAAFGAISLVIIALILAGILWLRPKPATVNAVAVLPFESETQTPDGAFICDGLTESLISKLSQLPGLKVISSFSVLQYKGKKVDLDEAGRSLGVSAVITGRVVQQGQRLSILTEMINVKDKTRIWGEKYDRPMGDIFAVQDEISRQISQNLRLRLTREEEKTLSKRSTENLEAYTLYVQGRFYWNRRTRADMQRAVGYFEQAVGVDPRYALGYASLAETYAAIGSLGWQAPSIAFPKAEEYALKALAIDAHLAEAHTALGAVKHWWKWDYQGAEREFQKAFEINPNYATAYQWLAELYMVTDRLDLANQEIRKAEELDPNAIIIKAVEAIIYLPQGRFDESIRLMKDVVEENPDFDEGRLILVHAYLGKKAYDEALKYAAEIRNRGSLKILTARILAAQGKIAEARTFFQDGLAMSASQGDYVDPGFGALVFADLGEIDVAIRYLEQASEQHSVGLFFSKVYLPSEKLVKDPRYQAIMRKAGVKP